MRTWPGFFFEYSINSAKFLYGASLRTTRMIGVREAPLVDRLAIPDFAVLGGPGLGPHPVQFQFLGQRGAEAEFDESFEDVPDGLGLPLIAYQPSVLHVVPERGARRPSTSPCACWRRSCLGSVRR